MARVMAAGVQTVFIITELLGDGMAHDISGSPTMLVVFRQ